MSLSSAALALLTVPLLSAGLQLDKTSANDLLDLVRLDKDEADKRGAHCLDGTAPAFFYKAAAEQANSKKWVLFIKGGEWCEDKNSCSKRAEKSLVGTTRLLGKVFPTEGAPMFLSRAPWNTYNRVLLWYCDGGLFGGDKAEAENGLFYQGRRILDFQLDTLVKDYNFGSATDVLLAGNSAGGLSVYIHADHVASYLPASANFRAVPISGYFQPRADDDITNELRKLYQLHDLSKVVSPECGAAVPEDEHWRCIFGNYSYAYSKTPMFPIQSSLDGFALLGTRDFSRTALHCMVKEFTPSLCTGNDIETLNTLIEDGVQGYKALAKARKPGEGGFLMSCPGHMMFPMTGSDKVEIDGKSMEKAVVDWWESDLSGEGAWYLPCNLNSAPPHQCNPSCHAAPPAGAR